MPKPSPAKGGGFAPRAVVRGGGLKKAPAASPAAKAAAPAAAEPAEPTAEAAVEDQRTAAEKIAAEKKEAAAAAAAAAAAVPRVAESMFDDVPAPKKVATAEEKQEAKALISSLRKQASKEAKEKQRIGR
jgi:hypothetical protein